MKSGRRCCCRGSCSCCRWVLSVRLKVLVSLSFWLFFSLHRSIHVMDNECRASSTWLGIKDIKLFICCCPEKLQTDFTRVHWQGPLLALLLRETSGSSSITMKWQLHTWQKRLGCNIRRWINLTSCLMILELHCWVCERRSIGLSKCELM